MKTDWHCFKLIGLALLATSLAGELNAQSTGYPAKPVRLISDSAPGSAVDVNLRIIADGLSTHWNQQVIVLNQPGAGGAISATVASEAPPDGYTLYAPALSVFLAVPGKAPNLPLMLPRDFLPIGFTAEQPISVGASPTLGVKTLPELIALAKTRPSEIGYAVSGVGRLTHLTGELLQMRADIKLQMVPYKGGSAQSLADVIAGRIPVVIEGYSGLAGAYQSGQLRPLAIASVQRLPSVPDLPTVAETLPGFASAGWQVVVAPLGTPDAIIRRVSDDLRKVLVKPEIKDKLAARGGFVRPMTPADVLAFVSGEQKQWKPVLERLADQMK